MSNKTKKTGGGNGGPTKQTRQQSHDSQDYSSFKTVLFYCMLIVFLPVLTFFVLKGFVLDQFFSISEVKVNIASAVGAVVALHIALGLYIYRAYFGASGSKAVKAD
ncbi:vacuolar ATPase assembly integral membrane protein VMA21 homolog [Drosophila serrata]|uniref:vacuolar ATPase assembly integral membrane protein VMA21 homolog n=1 Tax=Drosophila serrata TaxID=7274 RepID=UPI000A1D0210|nr:vacuolar ATPase assembly integral membrane protein VMA21 homolog [Drosophila serrata]KAH8381032.1 hypothetical protein KR200_009724 [Drosophila serrata]